MSDETKAERPTREQLARETFGRVHTAYVMGVGPQSERIILDGLSQATAPLEAKIEALCVRVKLAEAERDALKQLITDTNRVLADEHCRLVACKQQLEQAQASHQTMLTKAEFELLLDTIRLRESDTNDAQEQNTLIRIHTKLEGNQALLIRNKEHRMTVKEALHNAQEALEGWMQDNGYGLNAEIVDEATFADELESACNNAAKEYRESLEDEDEDGGDAADAAEVSKQLDESESVE